MPKIAFLGAGNMAAAFVDGLLAKHVPPTDLICLGGSGRTAAALAERTGITLAVSTDVLLADADTLVLGCKPQQLSQLDPRLAQLAAGKLVLSVLAGKRLGRLAQVFPRARNLVRCMPNTPAQIGAGITGWCALAPLADADRVTVTALLAALGQSVEVPEAQMDAVTGVSGSGPAYVFEFAAALRDGGIAAGLAPETAHKLAVETLLGAARLLARRHVEPETLRNQVTSPNGTTFAGLQRLAARDFRGMIRETVLAAAARSEELSRDA
ncbi:MAG TPA: pyrroline-5-carboxylate reductase [Opitutaceae bacterium]